MAGCTQTCGTNEIDLRWEFARITTQMSINLNGQVQVGDFRLDGRLNLKSENGKVASVKVLLGVAF